MAAPKSNSKTRSKWERVIAAGEASGLTATEYCKRHGINPKHYSLWKGKLRDAGVELPASGKAQSRAVKKESSASKPARTKSSRMQTADRSSADATPKVDFEAYSISATLLNGLVIEIKCPGEAELSLALQHLASL